MLKVSIIDPIADHKWDSFVYSHPYGWICHTSAWAKILKKSFKHIKTTFLGLVDSETGEIRAALPICEVRSWLTGNRLVSLPFATLCDPLINTYEEFKLLFQSAIDLQKKVGANYIEIRIFQSHSLINGCDGNYRTDYSHHFLKLDRDLNELYGQIKRNFRRCIRKGQEAQIELLEGNSYKNLKEFYYLHLKMRKRLNLPPHPYHFIKTFWEILHQGGNLDLLMARCKNKIIGGIILLKFKDRISAEYLASDYDYLDVKPNHFLVWNAIKRGKEQGYQIFDFGRTAKKNSGLLSFKRDWGAEEIDLVDVYYQPKKKGALIDVNNAKRRLPSEFFKKIPDPFYRAIGNYCYRHLG